MSSQIWCYVIFGGDDDVCVCGGGGEGEAKKIKFTQDGVKHVLVLEFLRSEQICEFFCELTS